MEALNHKGIKGDKLSAEIVAEQYNDSRSQVFHVIRPTELVVGLLDKVDAGKLTFNPTVELSALSQTEQAFLPDGMMFANKVDIGGRIVGTEEWVIGNSTVASTIFNPTPRRIPQSGW